MFNKVTYLSPSAINLYYQDPKEYYKRYLSTKTNKSIRPDQTKPMAAGSSFDAYVKSFLFEKLLGKGHKDYNKFELDTLLAAQVDAKLLDWAKPVGHYLFHVYNKTGALADLLLDLNKAIGEPKFEIEVMGAVQAVTVAGHTESSSQPYRQGKTATVGNVVLLGKPDLMYINHEAVNVILDWKVSGFEGRYKTQPLSGYLKLRSIDTGLYSKSHNGCVPAIHKGVLINCATYLEKLNADWALQLSIYGWLLGANVGEELICQIHQMCCDGTNRILYDYNQQDKLDYPSVRVAEHSLRISRDYQHEVYAKAHYLWDIVQSDHFFRDMSLEDSVSQCLMLDALIEEEVKLMQANSIGMADEKDIWLSDLLKRDKGYKR